MYHTYNAIVIAYLLQTVLHYPFNILLNPAPFLILISIIRFVQLMPFIPPTIDLFFGLLIWGVQWADKISRNTNPLASLHGSNEIKLL